MWYCLQEQNPVFRAHISTDSRVISIAKGLYCVSSSECFQLLTLIDVKAICALSWLFSTKFNNLFNEHTVSENFYVKNNISSKTFSADQKMYRALICWDLHVPQIFLGYSAKQKDDSCLRDFILVASCDQNLLKSLSDIRPGGCELSTCRY